MRRIGAWPAEVFVATVTLDIGNCDSGMAGVSKTDVLPSVFFLKNAWMAISLEMGPVRI